jgi:4-amino-4-deoxy-L-arabinose transferase-like glycosyltransferase
MWAFLPSKPVVCLLAAAFFVRMVAAIAVQYQLDHHWQRRFVIEGDAEGYWMLGSALANDAPYAAYDPPRYVLRMPGFPLLLAIPIRLTGGSFLAARIFLAMIGTATCGLVYLLGRDLCSGRTGLLAGWFTVLSPALVGFSVMILSETAFALGILASLWGMTRLLKAVSYGDSIRPLIAWAMFTGAAIALGTYMRPSWLPMAGLFPLGLAVLKGVRRETVLAGGVIVSTVCLAMFPWAARNYSLTGHWVVTTLWSGPSLYDGLNPEADGSSNMEFMTEDNLLSRMTEYELNRHYWQKGIEYAKENPGRAVELALQKLWRYWKIWPSAEEAGGDAVRLAISLFTIVLFAGAFYGVWHCLRKPPHPNPLPQGERGHRYLVLALTVGPILFFAALHAVFVGSIRYRLPAEYPLAVIAAAGWWQIMQHRTAEAEPGGGA